MSFESESSIEESLIFTVFDLVNFLTKNSESMLRESGLSVQQWMVLLQIANDSNFPKPALSRPPVLGRVYASEIANARGVSRPNISSLVAPLLEKGFVKQAEDPGDRRRKTLQITPLGLQALEQIEPVRRQINRALFGDFTDHEKEEAMSFLQRWLEKLWRQER